MSTKQSLQLMIPQLVDYINKNTTRLKHATKLQNIFEGQLLPYLLATLRSELSPRAYERIVQRAVPINVLTRIVNKLSKLYSTPVFREATTPVDQDIMDKSVNENNLNTVFGLANKLYSLHQYFAIEPYFHNGIIKVRVLDPSQFLVYSDDNVSREMTVFLKYMGPIDQTKDLWFGYSDQEFIAFDTQGEIRMEWMYENQGINPLGVIPFIYINQYSTKLMPQTDSDIYEMTIRIPQLLSDLAYCHKFQAHSMIYAIDLDPATTIDGSPDGFTLFNSRDGEGKTGSVDFLKPQIEIEASLKLVVSNLSLWLESKGIKSGTVGDIDSSLSGVAKILDEMDTTQARKEQVDIFAGMEDKYWILYSKLHNYYLNELNDNRKGMTEIPLESISFTEQKPIEDEKSKIEKIAIKLREGLTSKRRAVKEANPDLDDKQLDELLIEIENEKISRLPVFEKETLEDTEEE